MTAKGLSPAQLMSCSDADFDNNINNMAVKDLMGLISSLQKEMTKEQENFNSLSSALQGLKDRKSRQYKTISRDMVASQGRLTTLMNRSMKCFSQVNGVPSLTAGGRVQGQYVKRTAASKAPTPATSTATATTNGRTELEKVHTRLRTPRDINLSALPDKPTGPASSTSSSVQNGGREVTYFTTNLDRKKSSSSIVLGQKSDFDDDVDSSSSAFARPSSPSQGMQLSPLRKAQSREELYAIESKARVQKDAMLKEIGNRKSDSAEDDAYNAMPVSGHWGLKGNSLLAQRLQKDEQERTEQTPAPTTSTKNTTPHSPITNGNMGWGGGGGGGGLSISIRSTSRENLAEPDPPVTKKQLAAPAKGGKSAPPPSSSSLTSASKPLSAQASSSAPQQTSNKVKVTTTIMPTVATTTAPVPKRTAPVAPSAAKTTPAAAKTTPLATATMATVVATKTVAPAATTTAPAATKTAPAETRTATATVKTVAAPLSDKSQNNTTAKPASSAAGTGNTEKEFTDLDDENTPRMNLINWDPKPVLDELYKVKLQEETAEDISHNFVSMEGLMEKLPMNKKKSTLLKTWKRRFFRAQDGWLQYYETSNRDKPSETLQLMGGHVDDMGNRILGIDDGRGHYLMVRAPTDKEHGQWKIALESQTADNTKATYVQPVLRSAPHSTKHVVVIDMGSSAIRAGVLGEKESLPQVFFPSVVAVNKETGKKVVGAEAYHPEVRKHSTLLHPIRPSNKVDQFNIDVDMMSAIFRKVFDELKVNPSQYMVMLSTPQTLSDSLRAGLMNALVENLGVQGVCMVQQSLLALYSYRTSTGIIVDIGHRIEILPIYDGFVIEGGVARCPYGSQKVIDSLKKALLETNFKFASEVELLLVRYIMEQSCYVANDYRDEETLCETQPGKLKRDIHLNKFDLPEGAYRTVEIEEGRFSSPEGFFNVDLWEMDYPTLHKLIFHAIQSCPMDNRRHMYRSVYLSGGVTMLPGFQDRLLTELKKLAPPAVTVEVHASANRYHAAYLGACSVASMPQFKDMAISRDEWRREGARAFRKWQTATS